MKKIFIISSVLLGITMLIWGVYNFAFKKSNSLQTNKTVQQKSAPVQTGTATQTAATKKQEKITLISKDPIFGAVNDKKTEKIFYYSVIDGTVWQVDSDGLNLVQIDNAKLTGLVGVNWSPDRTKVLTNFNKEGRSVFFFYDKLKKVATKLKENLDNVVWDGLGGEIVYKYYDNKTQKRSLSIANPDGSNWQTIADNIPFRNISISAIPLSSVISFWNSPAASEESILQTVTTTGGAVKEIFRGKFGADYLWSPEGKMALVSSLTDKNSKMITLGIIDSQGNYQDLGIPTMVSKCAWSVDGRTIYYALPGGIPTGATMPDDYQNKKFTTSDTFWKIDITTGSRERILQLDDIDGTYDVASPFLSSTENSLFFTNRIDGKLYRIGL